MEQTHSLDDSELERNTKTRARRIEYLYNKPCDDEGKLYNSYKLINW
jgi:hypothetical protein